MGRPLSTKSLMNKTYDTYQFDGLWRDVFGTPEKSGVWLIYGKEKHGKTWFSLLLAEMLTQFEKVDYISAEEGHDMTFQEAVKRAKIDLENRKLTYLEYTPIPEVVERIHKRRAAKAVVFDNVTVYAEELKRGGLERMIKQLEGRTLIFLAHEEDNKPYTAQAKMIKKLAKVIVRIDGLTAFVSGRCPGGALTIDENKAALYHGHELLKND